MPGGGGEKHLQIHLKYSLWKNKHSATKAKVFSPIPSSHHTGCFQWQLPGGQGFNTLYWTHNIKIRPHRVSGEQ